MNHQEHPDVYQNMAATSVTNQTSSQTDTFSEWMKEQQAVNDTIHRQLNLLETLMNEQKRAQSSQLKTIRNRLFTLQKRADHQAHFEKKTLESMAILATDHQSLQQMLTDEHSLNQQRSVEIQDLCASTKDIAERLELCIATDEELASKVSEQFIHQQALSEQLAQQEDAQQAVVGRLDAQQGTMVKMLGQVEQLRSILYERTNMLTKKIEDTMSAYLTKRMTGLEQPMTHFWMNPKPEEKQEKID
ncbi:hypothetical protein MKY34_10200 [Sporosarcina sp. FSL K6-1522]|uniref:hypothetical protein n=1 Tax=Sporosarcina sp. FSL K6-1522 TaxID=2921554 RepID=UPI00315AD8F3